MQQNQDQDINALRKLRERVEEVRKAQKRAEMLKAQQRLKQQANYEQLKPYLDYLQKHLTELAGLLNELQQGGGLTEMLKDIKEKAAQLNQPALIKQSPEIVALLKDIHQSAILTNVAREIQRPGGQSTLTCFIDKMKQEGKLGVDLVEELRKGGKLATFLNEIKRDGKPTELLKELQQKVGAACDLLEQTHPKGKTLSLLKELGEKIETACLLEELGQEVSYTIFEGSLPYEGRQTHYQIQKVAWSAERDGNFALCWECVSTCQIGRQKTFFRKEGNVRERTNIEDFLRNNQIAFTLYEAGPGRTGEIKMTFDITPVIKIRFDFAGNPETGMLELTVQNCGGLGKDGRLGKTKFIISPSQVGPKLVEALIRYVLRKPNQLAMLANSSEQTAKVAPKIQNSLLDLEEDLLTLLTKIAQEDREIKQIVTTTRKETKQGITDIKTQLGEMQKFNEKTAEDIEKFNRWLAEQHEQEAKERATLFQWLVGLVGFKTRTGR